MDTKVDSLTFNDIVFDDAIIMYSANNGTATLHVRINDELMNRVLRELSSAETTVIENETLYTFALTNSPTRPLWRFAYSDLDPRSNIDKCNVPDFEAMENIGVDYLLYQFSEAFNSNILKAKCKCTCSVTFHNISLKSSTVDNMTVLKFSCHGTVLGRISNIYITDINGK